MPEPEQGRPPIPGSVAQGLLEESRRLGAGFIVAVLPTRIQVDDRERWSDFVARFGAGEPAAFDRLWPQRRLSDICSAL